jgi:hypothetical protein
LRHHLQRSIRQPLWMLWIMAAADLNDAAVALTVCAADHERALFEGGPMDVDRAAQPGISAQPSVAASAMLLAPGEKRAPTENLSPTMLAALIACVKGDGTLYKSCGTWKSPRAGSSDRPIFGVTVADLSREGMLTLSGSGKSAIARLTPRGNWFARTAVTEAACARQRSAAQ